MANVDKSFGFVPAGHLTGGKIKPRAHIATTSTTFYKGDLLKIVAGGTVEVAAAAIGLAAIGIAAETVVTATAGQRVLVWDDPEIIFMVQGVTGTTFTSADVNATADHVANAADTTFELSTQELDATGQAQFKIIGIVSRPDNAWGEHVDMLVVFNEHAYKAAVAGV